MERVRLPEAGYVHDCMVMVCGFMHFADGLGRNPIGAVHPDENSTKAEPDKPRVLVVDDEKLIADTTSEILNGAGFYARAAYDGWMALEIVLKFRPDYLLTDVSMPRMNGVELAIAITKMSPATRIVLFSGNAGISDILLKGQEQGYEFELVAKPIHPSKLVERLKDREK
jgi:CheY-like chemotaxis protein